MAPTTIRAAVALALATAASATFLSVPGPENIVAVRAPAVAVSAVVLEEWATNGETTPQQTATLAGCVLSNVAYQSYGSMAGDNSAAYWACGATGSLNRVLARLFQNGTVQYLPWVTTTNTYLPRGAAAGASAAYYVGDARGMRCVGRGMHAFSQHPNLTAALARSDTAGTRAPPWWSRAYRDDRRKRAPVSAGTSALGS